MRRVELELRELTTKRIPCHVYNILDNIDNEIVKLFRSQMATYSTLFDKSDFQLTAYNVEESRDIREYYLRHNQIPPDYNIRFQGYLRRILSETGYDGFFQILLDVYQEREVQPSIAYKSGKKVLVKEVKVLSKRDPLEILRRFIVFLLEKQGVPSWKLWKLLSGFRSHSGLHTEKQVVQAVREIF
jgi:hypothetical protein